MHFSFLLASALALPALGAVLSPRQETAPACVLQCISTSASITSCGPNVNCLCASNTFINAVASCLGANCDGPDYAIGIQVGQQYCAAAGVEVTIPTSVASALASVTATTAESSVESTSASSASSEISSAISSVISSASTAVSASSASASSSSASSSSATGPSSTSPSSSAPAAPSASTPASGASFQSVSMGLSAAVLGVVGVAFLA